jgi:hypothetical protein
MKFFLGDMSLPSIAALESPLRGVELSLGQASLLCSCVVLGLASVEFVLYSLFASSCSLLILKILFFIKI